LSALRTLQLVVCLTLLRDECFSGLVQRESALFELRRVELAVQEQVQELATGDAERLVFATLTSAATTRRAALLLTALRLDAQLGYRCLEYLQATPRVFVLGASFHYLHALQYVDDVVDPPPFYAELFCRGIQADVCVGAGRVEGHKAASTVLDRSVYKVSAAPIVVGARSRSQTYSLHSFFKDFSLRLYRLVDSSLSVFSSQGSGALFAG
jgi:hypothetical protein